MNILITGGAGYLGTELAYKFDQNVAIKNIIIYDNLSRGNYNLFIGKFKLSKKVKFVHGDILNSRKLKEMLNDIDVVFHFAAKVTTPFANIDGHIFEQTNHWGTAELVYLVENSNVKKFIYASSVSVYGSKGNEIVSESSMPEPNSYYAISKYRGEHHVERLFSKMETIILRLGNIYGYSKSMRFDSVINKFMFDAHYCNRITISGSGEQYRSFIHIDNVSQSMEQIATNFIPSGTYNLTGETFSINEIVKIVTEIYPDLEFMYTNQQYQTHDLNVDTNFSLKKLIQIKDTNLLEELNTFYKEFSFIK